MTLDERNEGTGSTEWFCVHAIFYYELQQETQDCWLVHENVYLIKAQDSVSACKVIEGKVNVLQDLSEDGHLVLNDKPVAYKFAGIRKVISVEPHHATAALSDLIGLEVTYSEFEVDTKEQVDSLVNGEMVELLYRE